MWTNWVLDATLDHNDGLFCFIPVDNLDTGKEAFIVGMNIISTVERFDQGKIVGIIHSGGDDEVKKWIKSHPDIVASIKSKRYT